MAFFDYPTRPDANAREAETAFLDGATRAQWDAIIARIPPEHVSRGQTIFEAGTAGDAFFILVDGEVDVIARGLFGERVVARISAGSVFGEIAFLDGGVRTATVRAVQDGSMIRVTRDGFALLAAWEPALAARMMADLGRVCAQRLRRTLAQSRRVR
jgi:NTE family protein